MTVLVGYSQSVQKGMWSHYIFAYYLLLLFYNVIASYHGNTSLYTSNEKRNLVTFATTSAFSGHPPPTMKTDGPFKPLTLECCTLVLLYKLKKVNMSRMALSKVHCKEKRNDVLLTTRTLEHKSSAKQWPHLRGEHPLLNTVSWEHVAVFVDLLDS